MLVAEIQTVLCLWQVLLLSHNFLSFNQQAFTYLCHIRKATGLNHENHENCSPGG